nr:hypothetical protein pKpn33002_00019 [Klebsiella pneumoniae]
MAKRDFYPTGATCWQGGSCTRRGITRRHRYVTGGDGRKFESCPYTDDWYALGDTIDTFEIHTGGNDSNLLIVFYVQIMPDDFVMQLHRF